MKWLYAWIEQLLHSTYLHPHTSQGASPSLPSEGPTMWLSWYCDCGAQRGISKWRPVPGEDPLLDVPQHILLCNMLLCTMVTGFINKHLSHWFTFSCHFTVLMVRRPFQRGENNPWMWNMTNSFILKSVWCVIRRKITMVFWYLQRQVA